MIGSEDEKRVRCRSGRARVRVMRKVGAARCRFIESCARGVPLVTPSKPIGVDMPDLRSFKSDIKKALHIYPPPRPPPWLGMGQFTRPGIRPTPAFLRNPFLEMRVAYYRMAYPGATYPVEPLFRCTIRLSDRSAPPPAKLAQPDSSRRARGARGIDVPGTTSHRDCGFERGGQSIPGPVAGSGSDGEKARNDIAQSEQHYEASR